MLVGQTKGRGGRSDVGHGSNIAASAQRLPGRCAGTRARGRRRGDLAADPTDSDARDDLVDQAERKDEEVLDREGFEERLMQAGESEAGEDVPHVD